MVVMVKPGSEAAGGTADLARPCVLVECLGFTSKTRRIRVHRRRIAIHSYGHRVATMQPV